MTKVLTVYHRLAGGNLGMFMLAPPDASADSAASADPVACAHSEAKHRGIPGFELLAIEPRDDAKNAKAGNAFNSTRDFIQWRVDCLRDEGRAPSMARAFMGVPLHVDPALGPDMTVVSGRRAGKTSGLQQEAAMRQAAADARAMAKRHPPSRQYHEWLGGSVYPQSTPFMEAAKARKHLVDPWEVSQRRTTEDPYAWFTGKHPALSISDDVEDEQAKVPAGYTAEELDRDNPYNAWFTPEPVEHVEPANTTPRGLMMLSPMDGRLGNRWSPE
jgi:hypothetical protein